MNKKLLELLNSINAKKEKIRQFAEEGKLEEAKNEKEELKTLQDQFDLLKDLDDHAREDLAQAIETGAVPQAGAVNAIAEFANAARSGFRNTMGEGVPADGGYTVPEDIQTRIDERRASKASLADLVKVEPVTTNKGGRTYKKRLQQTGFTKVGEGGKIGKGATPQFERVNYEIGKYGGYFPVTNELLNDSDSNISNVLIEWIGDESRVTRNKIILDAIYTKDKTAITGLDDIKKALNVDLGAAFKNTSAIVTNDDGLQYLDTLKDKNGRDLLQPNVTEPTELRLRAGATTVPIVVIPNSDMPSNVAEAGKRKIPFVIGDLNEGIAFFDRQQTSIITSNVAAVGELNAFEEDLVLYRAIEREDCKIKDADAFVNGELVLEDASVTGE